MNRLELPVDPPTPNHGMDCECSWCEDHKADLADQARDDAKAEGLV